MANDPLELTREVKFHILSSPLAPQPNIVNRGFHATVPMSLPVSYFCSR